MQLGEGVMGMSQPQGNDLEPSGGLVTAASATIPLKARCAVCGQFWGAHVSEDHAKQHRSMQHSFA